jgi:hypothetical protein
MKSFKGFAIHISSLLPLASLQTLQVRVQAAIGQRNEPPVKHPLAGPALVSRHQQHRFPLRIERKCDAPNAIVRVEAQLLHVRVLRSLECVNPRASCGGTERLEDASLRQ